MTTQATFEEALQQLEDAVEKLEQGELPLDQALDCFERGVQSANLCRKQLKAVEARLETLTSAADGTLKTQPFDPQPYDPEDSA
jgi:exodeoxyribonuclease VII small subunit